MATSGHRFNDAGGDVAANGEQPTAPRLMDAALLGHLGAWVYDRSSGRVTCSQELCYALGVTESTVTSLDGLLSGFAAAFHPEMSAALEACFTHGEPVDLEVPMIARTGALDWVRMLARATLSSGGTPCGAYGVVRTAYGDRRALWKSEERLRIAQQVARIGSWEVRLVDQVITWSEETYRIFGVSPDAFVPTTESIAALIHPDDIDVFQSHLEIVLRGELPMNVELRIVTPGGGVRRIRARAHTGGEPGEGAARLVGTVEDVTEKRMLEAARQEVDAQLIRMNHLYRALSDINKATAQVTERAPLLERICEVLVESGGFRMAWIGWHDPERRSLDPVAVYGHHAGFLDHIVVTTDKGKYAKGPGGRAFVEGSPFICNDIAADPIFAPWRSAALARGFLASASFPIYERNAPVGVLFVYADRADFFQAREITLITEAAASVSFAFDNQRRDLERHALASNLATQRERLEEAQAVAHVGSWENDLRTGVLQWSRETFRMFGEDPERFQPTYESFLAHVHPDDRAGMVMAMAELTASSDATHEMVVEHRIMLPSGKERIVEERGRVVRDASGTPDRAIGTCADITERHAAEAAAARLSENLTTTLESITDAFLAVDRSWRVTYFNHQVVEQLRVPAHALVDGTFWEAVPDCVNSPTGESLREAMHRGVPITREHLSHRVGAWFEVRAYPSAQGLTVSFRNITDRRRAEAQLRAFALRLEAAQENERAVIARDVHDGLGQSLSVLLMDASRLADMLAGADDAAALVDEMRGILRATLEESRSIARSLHPSALDDLGLTDAIEMHVAHVTRRSSLEVALKLSIDDQRVDRAHAAATYRILQESLTNVLRHARATRVTIALEEDDGVLRMEVADNGVGIAPSAVRGANSLGVVGMRERAAALDGSVEVAPAEGGGTRVLVRIPLGPRVDEGAA